MIFYLKLIRTYLFLKLKINTSKHDVWRLDFFIFALRNNISIVSENKDFFTVKYKLNNWQKFNIRHYPSSDFSVFKTVIIEKQYNLDYIINEGNEITIIDAGANAGYTTIFYKDKYPKSKIIAIEPFDENFTILTENVTINNLTEVYIEKNAVWFEDSELFLNFNFRDSREHSVRTSDKQEDSSIQVNAKCISSFVKKYNLTTIEILKLDIEGSEKEIFETDKKINEILKITGNLVIEIHDEFNCRNQILAILDAHFTDINNIGELTIGNNS
jgi:FkbM family methyltransferase